MGEFDRVRAAEVLVDAHLLGTPRAADKWGVTARTIRNYQTRLPEDAELARLYAAKLSKAERAWQGERLRFLRNALTKLDALVEKATEPSQISAVAHAVKVVGELQVASDVLNGSGDADPADPLASEAAGDAPPPGEQTH